MAITKLNSLAIPPDTVVESDISFPLDSASFTGDLTVDTDTLVVDSTNDRVGIGTDSPSDLLEVSSPSPAILVTRTGGSDTYRVKQNSGETSIQASGGVAWQVGSSGTDNVVITSAGRVGIGRSEPEAQFEVANTIRVSGAAPTIQLGESDSTDSNYQFRVSGGQLRLQSNNDAFDSASTQITMSSNGYLGIKETNPDVHLHLTHTSAPVMKFERNDTAVAQGNGIGQIQFAHREAGNEGVCAVLRLESKDGAGRGAFVFKTGLAGTVTEDIRVDSDGIKFGGETSAAHALDDYEEGTWNVTLSDGTTTSGTLITGRYTKIGNVVIARFDALNNINPAGFTGGNNVRISLPLTAGSTGRSTGSVITDGIDWGSSTQVNSKVSDSVAFANIVRSGANLNDRAINFQDINSVSTVNDITDFCVVYTV